MDFITSLCRRLYAVIVLLLLSGTSIILAQNTELGAHDPVMIKHQGVYYLFATGRGIQVASSTDMVNWTRMEPVFADDPSWVNDTLVPGHRRNDFWAPDIAFHNGRYYLYYSVSSFGRNTSAIGVASNKTLDPADPDFRWVDHGCLVNSIAGKHDWNAIDPNLVFDSEGLPWLIFGSWWGGIKMVRLNPDLISIAQPERWLTLAARERSFRPEDRGNDRPGIEAPFIFRKNGYYYLFVSYDHCCRGVRSDYNMVVGRSEKVTGPYLDRDGVDMRYGGHTQVLTGNESWPGVGHNSAYTFDGKDYLIFHGYDAKDRGRSKLLIREINWDEEGWPVVEL